MKVSQRDAKMSGAPPYKQAIVPMRERKRRFDVMMANEGIDSIPPSVMSYYAQELLPTEKVMTEAIKFMNLDAFKKAIERGHGADYVYNPKYETHIPLVYALVSIGRHGGNEERQEFIFPALRYLTEERSNLLLPVNYEYYQKTVVAGRGPRCCIRRGTNIVPSIKEAVTGYLQQPAIALDKAYAREVREILGIE